MSQFKEYEKEEYKKSQLLRKNKEELICIIEDLHLEREIILEALNYIEDDILLIKTGLKLERLGDFMKILKSS